MSTINRADYEIQSQVPFNELLDTYIARHVQRLASSRQTAVLHSSLL
jgi:hypothetical protein